jgi:hypothetical protein
VTIQFVFGEDADGAVGEVGVVGDPEVGEEPPPQDATIIVASTTSTRLIEIPPLLCGMQCNSEGSNRYSNFAKIGTSYAVQLRNALQFDVA